MFLFIIRGLQSATYEPLQLLKVRFTLMFYFEMLKLLCGLMYP